MNFEFERVFFEAKYSHRIFLNKFTKNFHNFFGYMEFLSTFVSE